ncbi:WD40 repeat-like protein [Xylariomycetidae sp. FL0641]|nr:WD40 repeat-like protein [Xylariomycetidae sp. FL0641]
MATQSPATEGARPSRELAHGDPKPSVSDRADSSTPNLIPHKNKPPAESPEASGTSILPSAPPPPAPERKATATASTTAKDAKDPKPSAKKGLPATPSPAIDPLSHHIFVRTTTDRSIAARLRNPTRPESPANEPQPRTSTSFLSRLSMLGAKKKDDDIFEDEFEDQSEFSEQQLDGIATGYIPHHKIPRYIRTKAHHKKVREYHHVFLAQELVGTRPLAGGDEEKVIGDTFSDHGHGLHRKTTPDGGPIWSIEFSQDGRYLATGGRDRVVRIWAVMDNEEDRRAYEEEENATGENNDRLSAPVFRAKPLHEFTGHTGDILDLSWSKNHFLLSSSMDKSVRLWHVTRKDCLCTFTHEDYVTSIAFHPRDDRFFLAGSLDSTLRLWSIPDKTVAYSAQLNSLITAVAFSPDGKVSIAGCLNGFCMFFETENLKYHTQIHVRSSRGKNAKGSKITGIQTMSDPSDASEAQVKILVTSNDSRIRIYTLGDKNLEVKLKGHQNVCSQIRATFSDDGRHIICGSEDRRAFIWSLGSTDAENKEKRPYEYFAAHSDVVTEAVFAPTKTRQLLQASGDPIFTLCNPPPVTLLSKEESDTRSERSAAAKKKKKQDESRPSPAFVARSAHPDGHVIVTTDLTGRIKVFRQDCAATKRRHENWETASSLSRRLVGRTCSIMTRTSATSSRQPHSRRGSMSQAVQGLVHLSSDRIDSWRHGVEGNHPPGRPVSMVSQLSTPARSERSLSPNKAARTPAPNPTSASKARRQPYAQTQARTQSPPPPPPPPPPSHAWPTSPTSSVRTNRTNNEPSSVPPTPSFSFRSFDDDDSNEAEDLRLDPAGASYSFWNLNKWRHIQPAPPPRSIGSNTVAAATHDRSDSAASLTPEVARFRRKSEIPSSGRGGGGGRGGGTAEEYRRRSAPIGTMKPLPEDGGGGGGGGRVIMPPTPTAEKKKENKHGGSSSSSRKPSYVSRLSSEVTSDDDDDEDEGEDMECRRCGSRDFRAKKVGGCQRLLCGKCGRLVDA